ncbi:TatD DNase family protein [Fluviicoccus keumensis]|uniref:TatD DNase family protein n=1 Tax=Fluviicoccus keumensis TaxID=1435465 RepID=A0A4Q7YI74_9GAMM|nr:TatD family hydrolase [Fluviicoccus keumensis]RZU37137.1 TatD DNase family protein [Fluviicoccus keumensis]
MLIDSHCHLDRLDLKAYAGGVDEALEAARAAGVGRFLTVSVDLETFPILRDLAERHADVYASVGVHPSEALPPEAEPTADVLVGLANHPRVIAIGESGLDYYYHPEHKEVQQRRFAAHIEASRRTGKPLIVHTRDARADTIGLLRECRAEQGILHCFTEDWDTAKAGIDLGFYVSLSGIVSFANAESLRDVARQLPLDRLLIETDSPYLAPVPYRGKKNEPRYLPAVAEAVAKARGITAEVVAEATTRNFNTLFGLPS